MFRPDRERRTPDRYIHIRTLLFVLGASIAVAGMATERDELVAIATAILAVGILLRWLGRRDQNRADE